MTSVRSAAMMLPDETRVPRLACSDWTRPGSENPIVVERLGLTVPNMVVDRFASSSFATAVVTVFTDAVSGGAAVNEP